MKFCEFCGRQLPDHASFCEICGAQQPAFQPARAVPSPIPRPVPDEGTQFLEQMRKTLRGEHLAWKIAAIVNTCLLGLAVSFVLVLLALDFPFGEFFEELFGRLAGENVSINFSFPVSSTLPGIIIGFIWAAKTKRAYRCIGSYPRPAIDHCDSVGSIILAALFNEVALIFVIINFVRCKSNKALIDQLRQRVPIVYPTNREENM